MATKQIIAPDLSKRPPRSPRVRLGGFVILPRLLDKGRAKLAGTPGEYHYAFPLDQRFFEFVKIDEKAVLRQLKSGLGDWEILTWILKNAKAPRAPWEVAQWSTYNEARVPDGVPAKERAVKAISSINPHRTDILTGFDLLDLDDYITFGGKA